MNTAFLALLSILSVTFRFQSDGGSFFQTPDSLWIKPGTLLAVADGDTISAVAGVSGSMTGVVFPNPPSAGSMVTLSFDTMDVDAPSSASLDVEFIENRTVDQLPVYVSNPFQEHGLYISGSKRIGFSVGEGGGLDQGTRISVEGTAAPGITVSGSVTDQNLSYGASSSELVSQLDRIFFLVDGGSWQARLGDMEWMRGNGETGPFSWRRQVSGVSAQGNINDSFGAGAGYGTSGDTRQRTVFYTSEGVQGPYQVTSGWEVVPGSEKVWLDGQLMSRGASADYTMEYTAGLITFTSTRLIRNEQRVEITFYQRGDGFRKDFITSWGNFTHGDLTLSLQGFHAQDDKGSPLGFVLTEEAVEVLRAAGEDPSEAWVDGATCAGDGKGDYSVDSLGHYVYQGPDQGDWDVVFGRPPQGPGDYVYNSSVGGYVWAGQGSGTHLPRIYVQIPSGYSTGGVSLDYAGEQAGLEMDAAISRRTGNLFNPEMTTREGSCIDLSGGFDFWPQGPGIRMNARLVSSGYNPPGELEADSSISAWSLPAGYRGNDDLVGASVGGEVLRVSGAGRFMERGGVLERYGFTSRPVIAFIGIDASGTWLQRRGTDSLARGNRSDLSLSAAPVSGILRPFAGFSASRDSWSDSLSGHVRTVNTGLAYDDGTSDGTLRLEFGRDSREGVISPGPSTVWRARLQGGGPLGKLRYRGSLEHSSTSYDAGGLLQADAIDLRLTGTSGDIWSETVYSGSGTVSRSLDVIYTYVGEGEGDYSYDPESGQYYPDPDGDFIVSYSPGGEGGKITSASLETTVSYSGVSSGMSAVARVSSSSQDDRTSALLLYGAFDEQEEGGYSLDVSPWFRWQEGLLTRLTLSGSLRNERVSYSGAGLRDTRSWSVKTSPQLTPSSGFVIECSAGFWRKEEELYTLRDTRGIRIQVDPTLEILHGLKPGITGAWESRREVISDLDRYMLEVGPHVTFTGGGWTATSRVTAGYIPGEGDLPAWFFDGSDSGVSWRVTSRIGKSLASGLDLSLFYWGRRPAGSSWDQRAGLEGNVNF